MKSAKQQSASFRKAIQAERAREAYITAKRGGEYDHLAFDDWQDDVIDIVDLSAYAPLPSSTGWEGLGA